MIAVTKYKVKAKKQTPYRQRDPFDDETSLANEYKSSKISIFYDMLWEWDEDNTLERKNSSSTSSLASQISNSIKQQAWIQGLSVVASPNGKTIVPYKQPRRCLEGCGVTHETGAVCKCWADGKFYCMHPKSWRIGSTYIFHERRDANNKHCSFVKKPSHRRMLTLEQVSAAADLESKTVSKRRNTGDKFRMFA